MKNIKMICFDMDNTIADLYRVDNWESLLRAEDPTPYKVAAPMWDMEKLADLLIKAQTLGIKIAVVTWLSMDSTEEYKKEVRKAKKEWLSRYGFPMDYFYGQQYGTTKADPIRRHLAADETALLIDDNAKVRNGWHLGDTIDPTTKNIIEVLKGIVENVNS